MLQRSFVILSIGLSLALVTATNAADPSDSLALVYDDGAGNTLLYRLFLPPGYDEPGAEFPLVLFLHGSGEIGTDNFLQVGRHVSGLIDATQSEEFAAFLLAPQVQPGQGSWSQLWSPTELAPAMELTMQVIDQLKQQYAIDSSRVAVTGLSMGGFGTWDVVAKRPEVFSAAVPMSGGGDTDQVANLLQVPIWNFHGTHDDAVDASLSREMIGALEDAGGSPLYLEYPLGHHIWGPIYSDPHRELYSWMLHGVEPPLATVIYNSQSGNLSVDAESAPGSRITKFFLRFDLGFTLGPTVIVDGTEVSTDEFLASATETFLTYNAADTGGFGGIADFGAVLPAGLDTETLHEHLTYHVYSAVGTGTEFRVFRLQTVVPEPAAAILAMTLAAGLACMRTSVRRAGRPRRGLRRKRLSH